MSGVCGRPLACLAVATGLVLACDIARPDAVDSEHLFGFTEGTDIGSKGDREIEIDGHGRFGKRHGHYSAVSIAVGGKFSLLDNFSIAPAAAISHHHIGGVPGLDDRKSGSLEGALLEMKFRVVDRQRGPFGLTVGVIPSWARVDATSGEPVREYGVGFRVAADKALVADKLFGALNLSYELATARPRVTNESARDSALGLSAAMAAQVCDGVFLGGEVRYARAYGGLGLDHFAGHALFVGPTFYAELSKSAWIAAGWNIQLAGRAAGDHAPLDLANFERREVKVRFGYAF